MVSICHNSKRLHMAQLSESLQLSCSTARKRFLRLLSVSHVYNTFTAAW